MDQAPNSTISEVIDGAGPITGLFVLLVVVALVLLMRSMARQLRKVDPNLPDGPADLERRAAVIAEEGGGPGSGSGGGSDAASDGASDAASDGEDPGEHPR